jgi:outer membrane protein assembly factor BamB
LWSLENPSNATANGPVSVANGIVFAGSTNVNGTIYAINGKNGEILWSYETGSTIYGGISISNGCIYFGNGYNFGIGTVIGGLTGGTSLYAFCV